MRQNTLNVVALRGADDPLLPPWLDLYETAFPADERVPVSRIVAGLQDLACGDGHGNHFLAALGESGQVVGMMYLYEPARVEAAFLWYFAVAPAARSGGLGSGLYQYLIAHLRPGTKALIFDLEDPEEMETPEARSLAERRVAFYRRQGARMLGGIRYIQKAAPHLPELHLRLMVHPLVDLSPRAAFDCAKAVFADAISEAGELHWA